MKGHTMQDEVDEGGISWIAIVAVVAVVVAAVAFFAGRALAGGGPATLSEAVEQAQAGELPCGDVGEAPAGDPGAGGPPAGGPPSGGDASNAGLLVRAVCADDEARPPAGGPGGPGGGRGFGQQVKSVDGDQLTLTGPQGDTTVTIGPDTTVTKSAEADAGDLKAGDNVIVMGGRQGEAATSVMIVP
jgi:hypothetical protein